MVNDLEAGCSPLSVLSIKTKAGLGCGCFVAVAMLVTLVTVLASIHELGPGQQMLVKDSAGHWVKNGPWRGVLVNVYDKKFRDATVLKPEEYAVVHDLITGEPRHEVGPQLLFLKAYDDLVEVKSKIVLHKDMYALVKNEINGTPRHEVGPMLLHPGIYDKVERITSKHVLKADEYLVLADQITGSERVVRGPQTFVPRPLEQPLTNVSRRAVFLDDDTAVLVLNRTTGVQRLVQRRDFLNAGTGVFFPGAYEDVLQVRSITRVLPHESVVVQDTNGRLTVRSGSNRTESSAFFLQPYEELLTMSWSDFRSSPTRGSLQEPVMVAITKIDMRAQKMFFQYEVRTNDNVQLILEGTVFWKILDVARMISATPDPESDVWHHARSALIEAVSNATLADFMTSFNTIIKTTWARDSRAEFYSIRGVELQTMELTRFDCADRNTAIVLQEIIQETTNRINRLTAQESDNEVRAAKLTMDIKLEKRRSELILTQSENVRLQSQMKGEADGMKLMKGASAFIEGLNASVPEVADRVALYKLHQQLNSRNTDIENLATGTAHLFLTPEDVKLKLQVGGGSSAVSGHGADTDGTEL